MRTKKRKASKKDEQHRTVRISQDVGHLLLVLDCLNRFVPAFMLVVAETVGKKKLDAIMSDKRVTKFAGLGWNAVDIYKRVGDRYKNDYPMEGNEWNKT